MACLDMAAPFALWLPAFPKLGKLFSFTTINCPCHYDKRKPNYKCKHWLLPTKTVYTGGLSASKLGGRREKLEPETDPISILNERIRRDYGKRDAFSRQVIDSKEADKYIQMVKEQQQRGLRKLKGEREGKEGGVFNYKVDPYTLQCGDYVVHKKVGIGRFVGIKFDLPKDSTEPIEYVFIEYADGMAKLPVKQASRMLYRYYL